MVVPRFRDSSALLDRRIRVPDARASGCKPRPARGKHRGQYEQHRVGKRRIAATRSEPPNQRFALPPPPSFVRVGASPLSVAQTSVTPTC
jgi:hypothetical protein